MDSIRIRNLRCLEDTGTIELKPITILLGKNSSGKSSFLRMFPLLRQTAEARTSSPLLWFGRLVDFGSFEDAMYSKAHTKTITLNLGMKVEIQNNALFNLESRYLFNSDKIKEIEINTEVSIANDSEHKHAFVRKALITILGHTIEFHIDDKEQLSSFKINNIEFSHLYDTKVVPFFGSLIPSPKLKRSHTISTPGEETLQPETPEALDLLTEHIRKHIGRSKTTIYRFLRTVSLDTSENIAAQIEKNFARTPFKKSKFDQLNSSAEIFDVFRNLIVALSSPKILSLINGEISNTSKAISYIEPLRATTDRFYRFQDLAVDEIDTRGYNLPMFIHALNTSQQQEFCKWTSKYFGFTVEAKQQHSGHLSLIIEEASGKHNLSDTGFGYSQVLPIATQLWWQNTSGHKTSFARHYTRRWLTVNDTVNILAIEQPELHLHPALQAAVAEAFVAAVQYAKDQGNSFRIIAETHSEAIINRVGKLISEGKISNEDVNIVLFERETMNAPARVRFSTYDEKGYLENWPYGFFNSDTQ